MDLFIMRTFLLKQCSNNVPTLEPFLQFYFSDCNSENVLTSIVTRRGFGTKQKLSRKHLAVWKESHLPINCASSLMTPPQQTSRKQQT